MRTNRGKESEDVKNDDELGNSDAQMNDQFEARFDDEDREDRTAEKMIKKVPQDHTDQQESQKNIKTVIGQVEVSREELKIKNLYYALKVSDNMNVLIYRVIRNNFEKDDLVYFLENPIAMQKLAIE